MTRSRRKPAAQRYAERKIRVALAAVTRQQREQQRAWAAENIDPFRADWCEIVDTRNPPRSA